MRQNHLAPAVMADMGDGKKWQFRGDQNAVYELEETTGIPVAAWLMGYGEETVEIPRSAGDTRPPLVVRARSRMLDLAWACSATQRADSDPDITPAEFRSLLPTGPAWEALVAKLERIFSECFMGPGPRPTPGGPAQVDPAPAPTGNDESSRD